MSPAPVAAAPQAAAQPHAPPAAAQHAPPASDHKPPAARADTDKPRKETQPEHDPKHDKGGAAER
jgi:hypothetical protein